MSAEQSFTSTILIVDPMEFRREGIMSTLEPWAETISARLVAVDPETFVFDGAIDDVLLVVVSLGGTSLLSDKAQHWLECVHEKLPDRPLAILSDIETSDEAFAALRAGAKGLLPTSLKSSVILHALAFVQSGGTYFSPALLLQTARPSPSGSDRSSARGWGIEIEDSGELGGLTLRQNDVLALLKLGRSNKLIARELDMQESTVKVHVRQIMRKMGAANRTQAALMASHPNFMNAGPQARPELKEHWRSGPGELPLEAYPQAAASVHFA